MILAPAPVKQQTARRTKIICTIGPASENPECIRDLIREGMNVARINFSHCKYDEALNRVKMLREARAELGVPLAIMLDTKGPEVRMFGYSKPVNLAKDDSLYIESTDKSPEAIPQLPPEDKRFFTNLPRIDKLCRVGSRVLLQDGFIEAEVTRLHAEWPGAVTVRVLNDGRLKDKAHLAVPGADYPIPFMSEKDKADIRFAVENGFEYIALSFVRTSKDIADVRALVKSVNPASPILLIAKIEDKQALANIYDIIRDSDGIMIARGDLGIEVPIEELPGLQKNIIKRCYLAGKPVIVATQMLESMTDKPYPTRAEVTDTANAVMELTSAVMLSGETANGSHPARVVNMMGRIIDKTESAIDYRTLARITHDYVDRDNITNIMAYSTVDAGHDWNAKAVAVVTASGIGARALSKFRPSVPIYAFAHEEALYHQLALNWGVIPFLIENPDGKLFSEVVKRTMDSLREKGTVANGDRLVYMGSSPLGKRLPTNTIRCEVVGDEAFHDEP
ncbi:MAG: pyruvate kinase [Elusimicrobia bacterium GWA2_62_23]|nr:MAG: pyruvate kinase [Elusimicrobia bacterium GWA2_62_23]OGR67018.1 MAG: pyruvate kinase [Elusimicrobia bacterium GWC2_63_65]